MEISFYKCKYPLPKVTLLIKICYTCCFSNNQLNITLMTKNYMGGAYSTPLHTNTLRSFLEKVSYWNAQGEPKIQGPFPAEIFKAH